MVKVIIFILLLPSIALAQRGPTAKPVESETIWGTIIGNLNNQIDLWTELNIKAPKLDPLFTGSFTASGRIVLYPTDELFIVGGKVRLIDGARITSDLIIHNDNPLAFTSLFGDPNHGTVSMIRIGGTGADDIFLSAVDGSSGTNDSDQGRHLVAYARKTTPSLPVSGVSLHLAGWYWDGVKSATRQIELENKVQIDGRAQFWIEEITDTGAFPFLRMFRSNTSDGNIVTHDQPGNILNFGAYDIDDRRYQSFIKLTAGVVPTASIQATTYLSGDGSLGVTVTNCTQFKNGLCVSGN